MTSEESVTFALRRRQLQLKQKRLAAMKSNGLLFYKPHEKQRLFHEAAAKYKRRMVRAGNRFGKSHLGCAEDCAWMKGAREWLPVGDPLRTAGIPQHPVKLLTITTDWDKVDEIFTSQRGEGGKVWKFLPKGFAKSVKRNHSGAIDTIECQNGGLWRFDTVKSYMANPQGLESSDWDAIHVDEPCPEGMWLAASRGLMDRNGSAWFTLTPLREPWITDYFFPEDTGSPQLREGVWALDGSTYDNPYLSREAVAEFEASLTEDERQCRIHGKPLHLAGLVYKEFDYTKHVLEEAPDGWEALERPPRDYSYYVWIDPHPETPHAVLFCAVDPFGRRYYYTDLFKHCIVSELCEEILEKLDGRRLSGARIDPLAYINDPLTGRNMADEFHRCGIPVEKATKALESGILKVKAGLRGEGRRMVFCKTARRTLWEIRRYCWDEKDNRPVDRDDHMMENLYRAELQEPCFVDAGQSFPVDMLELEVQPELGLEAMNYLEEARV